MSIYSFIYDAPDLDFSIQAAAGSVMTNRGVEKAKIWNKWDEEWAKSYRFQRLKIIDNAFNRTVFQVG